MESRFEVDGLKNLLGYNQLVENQKKCEPFEQLNQKYILLQKKYMNSFQKLRDSIVANEYRREYSKGGVTIHRGFYSPSSLDLVCGGCNRGRLLKSIPKNNKYDYEYIFDDTDKMICSKKYSDQFGKIKSVVEIELFVYEPNRVLSFVYEPYLDYALTFISECQYDQERLYRYESALCKLDCDGIGCTEINVEEIRYSNDLLQTIFWHCYNPSIRLLNQNKYTFTRDKEGYLSTYTVEQLNESTSKYVLNQYPQSYRVSSKRK